MKLAAIESGTISDPLWGKPITVSTTARLLFRKANTGFQKVKNVVLNKLIAEMYARGTVEEKGFNPKGSPGARGEARVLGGLKLIGIIDQNHVRVISVKGTVPSAGGLVADSGALPPLTTNLKVINAHFKAFMTDHLESFAQHRLGLSDNLFNRIMEILNPNKDPEVLKQVVKSPAMIHHLMKELGEDFSREIPSMGAPDWSMKLVYPLDGTR